MRKERETQTQEEVVYDYYEKHKNIKHPEVVDYVVKIWKGVTF